MQNDMLARIIENWHNVSPKEFSHQVSEYYEKERKEARLLVLKGYLIAVDNADEVFEIVFNDHPVEKLMSRLQMTKFQAQSLLKLSVGKFARLDREKIINKISMLSEWLSDYNDRFNAILEENKSITDLDNES